MGVTQDLKKMSRTMREFFGFRKLRDGQKEVIRSILSGRNTLAIMPTGAGKSLCYQLPALHLKGTTIIVSPLISLMKDQVDKLGDAGIEATQVNSALSDQEQRESFEQIESQESEFIFTTPERLTTPEFLETLRENTIDFIVIDESHCISEWGHDFRPSYLALGSAIKSLGSPPILALTATATPEVAADIQKQLDLAEMDVIKTGINRQNLQYEVIRVTNEAEKKKNLVRLFRELEGMGIVYCATVKSVEALIDFFQGPEFDVRAYHSKLPTTERKANQNLFMQGDVKAMIATNAFGMGIDKPDIRFVIHYQMPGSLEAYYQESGRAGRDGKMARCVLFYQLDDRRTQMFFMGGRYPKIDHIILVYDALMSLGANESGVSVTQVEETANAVPRSKCQVILALLEDMGVVREVRYGRFQLLNADLGHNEILLLTRKFEQKTEKDRAKLERMMLYGQSADCRWRLLHEYFDEPFAEDCGVCDNCKHPLEDRLSVARPAIKSGKTRVRRKAEKPSQPEFKVGDEVKTAKHGLGKIKEVLDDKLVIMLSDGKKISFKPEFVRRVRKRAKRGRVVDKKTTIH